MNAQTQQGFTPPAPIVKMDGPLYFHTGDTHNVQMHRPDGTKIYFINGYFEANFLADANYLLHEISQGSVPGLRQCSTEEEIRTAKYALNPKKAEAESMREQLIKELAAKGVDVSVLSEEGVANRAAQLIAGTEAGAVKAVSETASGNVPLVRVGSTGQVTPVGSDKLAGAAAGSSSAP